MDIYKQFICSKKTRKRLYSSFLILLLLILTFNLSAEPSFAEATEGEEGKRAEELRAELNAQIEELNKVIDKYRETIRGIQAQSKSLNNEISILDNRIKSFELEIKRINLIIQEIEAGINDIEIKIKEIEEQTENEKIILGELIREIHKNDEISFLEMILTAGRFSDFFSEIRALESLQFEIQFSLEEIRALKKELEAQKLNLEEQKVEMVTLRAIQETQKYSIEKKKKERKELLDKTKGQEYLYQRLVKNKQTDINTIRSQLYILQGMGGSLSFENALNIAEFAAGATGIRPAFVMAILSRESGLGKNVGTGTWREDMKPSHHSAFLDICKRLGLNPDLMPVSKKAWYGWGGAMGPAQFIPRTWLGYESRVATITGHNPPSPWDIEDAFVASALYLANAGATAKTYNAEWKAAMIYLAGSNWQKPYLRFYGDQVMDLAATIQEQINLIK